MKNSIKIIAGLALMASSIFISSCSNTPKGDEAAVTDEQTIDSAEGKAAVIDTDNSKVGFVGYGVGKNHPGDFKLSSGNIITKDGAITGGEFTINMKSLVLAEKAEMFQTKLLPHLLSADFFDAELFPTAKFEISSVAPYTSNSTDTSVIAGANYTISGNLTLKNITKNITFPAKITLEGNSFSALANFTIDRTLWGIKYGNDKSLKDKFISETVDVLLDIKSK